MPNTLRIAGKARKTVELKNPGRTYQSGAILNLSAPKSLDFSSFLYSSCSYPAHPAGKQRATTLRIARWLHFPEVEKLWNKKILNLVKIAAQLTKEETVVLMPLISRPKC